jgi:hypothetical protein
MPDRCLSAIAKRQNLLLVGAGLVLILAAFVPRLWLLQTRFFDRDELEHLHTAWLTFEGQLLYRDFFQNHTPLLYFFLAPLFMFYDVARNVDDAVALIFTARRLMWLLSGLILALTYRLGKTWRDRRVGLAATVFLAHTIMFLQKSLEIRPDLISVACWIGSLVLLVRGVQTEAANGKRARFCFAFSGFLLGMAIMATQKMLFAGPGLAVTTTWYLLDPRSHGSFKTRLTNILLQLAGLSAPMLLALAYFAVRGGFGDFIYFNLLLNAGWQIQFSPMPYLQRLFEQNRFIVGSSMIGVLGVTPRMFSQEGFRRGDYVVAVNGIGLFAGLFIIPVPHRQYFLMFLPLMALCAAAAVVDAIESLATRWKPPASRSGLRFLIVNAVLLATIAAIMARGLPVNPRTPMTFRFTLLIGVFGVALGVVHVLYGFRRTALAVLMIVASVYPLKQLHAAFYSSSNRDQLRDIRYVLENTTPEETVMDGQGGVGVFRPHAYFYWLLDPNIRVILGAEEKRKLLAALRRGEIAPQLIHLDDALQDLSPEITKFFEENYEPVNVGRIRVRRANASPERSREKS